MMCDNTFDLDSAYKKANEEYESSRERFRQKRIELGKQILRREENEFEFLRPEHNGHQRSFSLSKKSPLPEKDILFKKQKGFCALCKIKMTFNQATIDHILPKSKGGSNDISNKQLAHSWCNHVKGDSEEVLPATLYHDLALQLKEKVFYKKKIRKSQLEKSYLQHQIINDGK